MVKVIEPIIEKEAKKAVKKAVENERVAIAKNLLTYGLKAVDVAKNTGLSLKQVETLQREAAV